MRACMLALVICLSCMHVCGLFSVHSCVHVCMHACVHARTHLSLVHACITLNAQELINIAKNIKAPGIFIFLTEGHFEDEQKCKAISNKIEYLNLKHLVKHAEIHFEPDFTQTRIAEDSEIVDAHYELADETPKEMSPWVLRFVLDAAALDGKEMHLSDVVKMIKDMYHTEREEFEIIAADDNADEQVIRLRLMHRTGGEEEDDDDIETEDHFLRQLAIDMLHTLKARLYYSIFASVFTGVFLLQCVYRTCTGLR